MRKHLHHLLSVLCNFSLRNVDSLRPWAVCVWLLSAVIVLNPLAVFAVSPQHEVDRSATLPPHNNLMADLALPAFDTMPMVYSPEYLAGAHPMRTRLGASMTAQEKEALRSALHAAFLTFGIALRKDTPIHASLLGHSVELKKKAISYPLITLDFPAAETAYNIAVGNAATFKGKEAWEITNIMGPIGLTVYGAMTKKLDLTGMGLANLGFQISEVVRAGIRGNPQWDSYSPVISIANPLSKYEVETKSHEYLFKQCALAVPLAVSDEGFAKLIDNTIALKYTGVSIKADAYTLVNNSKLSLLGDYFRPYVNPDGSINLDLDGVNRIYSELADRLGVITQENIQRAKELDKGNGSIVLAGNNPKPNPAREAELQSIRERNQEYIDFASASIGLISSIAGFFNPKLSNQIAAVGGAAIKIATALNNFVATAATAATAISAISKIAGTIAVVGAVVSAALDIFRAFGGGGPSVETVILKQIQALRQQVEDMRIELHARFDRVEETLAVIYQTMELRFAQIDFQLGIVRGDVNQIRTDLVRVHAYLDRLEQNIFDWVQAGFRRDLVRAINGTIHYSETYPGKKMSFDTFAAAENEFYSQGYSFASDPLQVDYLSRGYLEADLYRELNKGMSNRNLPYVLEWIRRNWSMRLMPDISKVPDAVHWQLAVDAYLALGRENPDYRAETNPQRLKSLLDVGKSALSAREALTTLQTPNGPKANRLVYDSALKLYERKVKALIDRLDLSTNTFNTDQKHAWIKTIDPWKEVNQETAHVANFSKVVISHPIAGLPWKETTAIYPNNVLNFVRPFVIADYLGMGKLSIATSLSAVDARNVQGLGTSPCNSTQCGYTELHGKPRLQISIRYKGKLIYYKVYTHDKEMLLWYFPRLCSGPPAWNSCGEEKFLQDNWEQGIKLRERLEAQAVDSPYFTENDKRNRDQLLLQVTQQFDSMARSYQKELYTHLTNEFTRSSSIFDAARELSGAKALLNTMLTLGMPEAVETNEILHGLMHGMERLPDEEAVSANLDVTNEHYEKDDIRQLYQNALALLALDKPAPKVEIMAYVRPRLDALAKAINLQLDEVSRYHRDKLADPLLNNYPHLQADLLNTIADIESTGRAGLVNALTVAHPQSLTTRFNEPKEINLTGFDSGGAALTFAVVDAPTAGKLSGVAPNLVYEPAKDFIGRDSFTFRVVSGARVSNVATVTLYVTGAHCVANNYKATQTMTTSTEPYAAVSEDFNRDGLPDLAVANAGANNISLLLGNTGGGFKAAVNFAVGNNPLSLTAGDFNGDGRADLAVTNYKANNLSILLNNGNGGFAAAVNYATGTGPRFVTAGDFNKDGKADLAVSNRDSGNLSLFINNGNGTFRAAVNVAVGTQLHEVATADFNGDDKLDMVVANAKANSVAVLLGNSNGTFGQPTNFNVGALPISLAIGDFNDDGEKDLAVGNHDSNNVSLLLGDGQGRFAGGVTFDVAVKAFALATGDLNRDGKPDLAVAGHDANKVVVLYGLGNGDFETAQSFDAGKTVSSVLIGDYTADNKPDLIAVNSATPNLSLLTGLCVPIVAKPTLAAVLAANYSTGSLAPDSIVAAFGSDLATKSEGATTSPLPTILAGTTVKVMDSKGTERNAPLFFVAPWQINFLVPAETALGSAVITVSNAVGRVSSTNVNIAAIVPGLFSADASGRGMALGTVLRVKPNGQQLYEAFVRFDTAVQKFVVQPIDLDDERDKVFLILYGTGLRGRSSLSNVTAMIGGESATVLYAGSQGSHIGLDQVNIELSRSMKGRGQVNVSLKVDGKAANVVQVEFK